MSRSLAYNRLLLERTIPARTYVSFISSCLPVHPVIDIKIYNVHVTSAFVLQYCLVGIDYPRLETKAGKLIIPRLR